MHYSGEERAKSQDHVFFGVLFFVVIGASCATAFAAYLEHALRTAPYRVVVLPQGDGGAAQFEYGASPLLQNADYFNAVKSRLVSDAVTFIEANLTDMKLSLYGDGALLKSYPILSKGKVGSWWETPAGIYRVESKSESHFSSFGKVYQPWSMAFQGNFFIHGWPYSRGGEPVPQGYSGGCIRLGTGDAEEVYRAVRPGTPVLVFESEFRGDAFRAEIKKPAVTARNYLIADLKSNYVFLEQSSTAPVPVASIAKLVTAAVATEYLDIEKAIPVTDAMRVATSKPRLKTGEAYSVYDLLFPLLLESSNEAAQAFAATLGAERFVDLMNHKAAAIGMRTAVFEDASGSHAGNVASAEDLFNLAKYLYFNRSFLLKITAGGVKDSIYGAPAFYDLANFNIFEGTPYFIGGKIGRSEAARESLLAIFEIPINGAVRPIAVIVLQSDQNGTDAKNMLDWLTALYR